MKITILTFILVILYLVSFSQDSTYFNKLLFPQHGTNNLRSIVNHDSGYYVLYGWVDTPYVSNQGIGVVELDNKGRVKNSNLWWDTLHTYQAYPGNSMIFDSDSCLLICGSYRGDTGGIQGYLMKVDLNLDTLWTRTFTHPDTLAASQPGAYILNTLTAIRETYDGGFIISGNYNANCVQGNENSYLMKVDNLGTLIWIKMYSGVRTIYDVELAPDSGFYFPAVMNNSLRAVKTDKFGNIEWHSLVNSNQYPSNPMDLEILDSNYILVSSSYAYNTTFFKHGVVLAKIDVNTHSKIWEKSYILFNRFECLSLHQSMGLNILSDGKLIISGTSAVIPPYDPYGLAEYKGVLMKLNSNGDSLWARYYGYGLFTDECQFNDIVLTDDGGFLAVGWQWHNNGGLFFQNAWVVKMDSMGCDTAGCHIYDAIDYVQIRPQINMKIYPNPTSDYFRVSADAIDRLCNLELIIYDMQGRKVKEIKFENSNIDQMIDVSKLSTGLYSVSLYSGSLLLEVKQLNIVR